MSKKTSNNRRIAKNTLFMYIRMLLLMVVSLYTSRIVLQTLDAEDFGTYSIVGGVVVMFTFISSAMATGTQRHLSYELGKLDGDVATIFSACFRIHVALAVFVLLLAETIGLWFLNVKMNLPIERMDVINWIYQFSIITCMIGIIQVPYTALIVAHEKMSFYAYIGIFAALMKLGLVFLLTIFPVDKLFLYGVLLMFVALITFGINASYCHVKLSNISFVKLCDLSLYRKLLSFSGWSLLGALANVGYQQGVNIIINLFYGVTLNASVGIANQVNSAVQGFVANFQQALNPQLIQAEASKNRERQKDLIFKSSKFSFFIMYLISYPLIINLPCVLSLWLGEYPDHTVMICALVLVGVLISCFSGPLWVSIYAIGEIKVYQIIVSCVALSILPIIYIGGRWGMTPEQMFFVRAFNYVFVLFVQLHFLRKYIKLSLFVFFKSVLIPIFAIVILTIAFYLVIRSYVPRANSFGSLAIQTIMYISVVGSLVFFIGLRKGERASLLNMIFSKLKK